MKLFPQPPEQPCGHCQQHNWGGGEATQEPVTVVTLEGRFEFCKAAHGCLTEGCGNRVLQDCEAFLQLGFWPGTVAKLRTIFDIGMLQHWEKASKAMPGSSLSSFVGVLEETGRELGRVRLLVRPRL
jgi:hypothetical protein